MQWELFGDADRTYIKLLRNASRKIWQHMFSSTLHGNNKGQTILLQIHRGKRSRYLRYTWQVSGLIITYRRQPTSLLSERGENVNFETQDCENFPGEAGVSQHFLRKCIQLMTLRMKIFDKPLRRILTAVIVEQSARLDRDKYNLFG